MTKICSRPTTSLAFYRLSLRFLYSDKLSTTLYPEARLQWLSYSSVPQRSQRPHQAPMMTTLLPSSHLLAAFAHFRCLNSFPWRKANSRAHSDDCCLFPLRCHLARICNLHRDTTIPPSFFIILFSLFQPCSFACLSAILSVRLVEPLGGSFCFSA